MMRFILAMLFATMCLTGILFGGYTYFGAVGTGRAREDSVARGRFLTNPTFTYPRQYPTRADLAEGPARIAREYEDAVRDGYVLARQGDWDKQVMIVQSLLLLAGGVAGLVAMKRPNPPNGRSS